MASTPEIFETMSYGPAPEATGAAQAWLEQHGRRFGLFIGGVWTPGKGETFEALNPATAKPLATLAQASAADVDHAVRAARRGDHAPDAELLRLEGRALKSDENGVVGSRGR